MSGNRVPPGLLAAAIGAAVLAVVLYAYRHVPMAAPVPEAAPQAEVVESPPAAPALPEADAPADAPPQESLPLPAPAPSHDPAEALLETAGGGIVAADPADLCRKIGSTLESGDFPAAGAMIGSSPLTVEVRQGLAGLAKAGDLKLERRNTVREVGESVLDQQSRWALRLEGDEPGRERLRFDLQKKNGGWLVSSVRLPAQLQEASAGDSLDTADGFLQAALRQDARGARELMNAAKVSDAKLTRLCSLFHGGYRLRMRRPVLPVLSQPGRNGYIVRVEKTDGSSPGEISLLVEKDGSGRWHVADLNLDAVLSR